MDIAEAVLPGSKTPWQPPFLFFEFMFENDWDMVYNLDKYNWYLKFGERRRWIYEALYKFPR